MNMSVIKGKERFSCIKLRYNKILVQCRAVPLSYDKEEFVVSK